MEGGGVPGLIPLCQTDYYYISIDYSGNRNESHGLIHRGPVSLAQMA